MIIRDNYGKFCIKTYGVTPHLNRLKTVQMRGHTICLKTVQVRDDNVWFQ